jgi:transcription elongation GreA/GreB family factor
MRQGQADASPADSRTRDATNRVVDREHHGRPVWRAGTSDLAAADDNPDEATIVLWLLGDGDQALGENVVSFRAPVGQAIFNRREGEEIDLPRETGARRYRITHVEERLP